MSYIYIYDIFTILHHTKERNDYFIYETCTENLFLNDDYEHIKPYL